MEICISELIQDDQAEINEKFKVLKKVATGGFGTVVHAIEKASNKEVAVKIIKKEGASERAISRMKMEVSVLKQLNHENIVRFYNCSETRTYCFIVMEYICGDLYSYIRKRGKINESGY